MIETTPIWTVAPDDIEECLAIAADRYPDMDVDASRVWARARLENPAVCILRTKNAVSCAAYSVIFYAPRNLQATMVFFASRKDASPWEAYKLVKAQAEHAKARGCTDFHLGSITAVDLGPFARRLGFNQVGPNYRRTF